MKAKKTKQKIEDKRLSYYDIKDKDAFLKDDKNLNKIRSKNLKLFCKFVRDMKEAPVIIGLFGSDEKGFENTQNLKFGSKLLNKEIEELERGELEKLQSKLDKSIFDEIRHKNRFSKRTIYDYIYAYKYILACEGREGRLMKDIFEANYQERRDKIK